MKKIILFAALAFALVLSLSVFASAAIIIDSPDDMLQLMNAQGEFSDWSADYVLDATIDLSEATLDLPQAPIGTEKTPFTGTFDGKENTISGIDITGSAYVGLFGYVGDATIVNLTVSGTVTGEGNCVGGIIGRVYTKSLIVKNCTNLCTVSGVDSVGGIVGRLEPGATTAHISGCLNNGTVSATRYAAGIVGFHSQSSGATVIEECINNGSVSASNSYTGGIVGYWRVYGNSKNKCFVQDCMNSGNVTGGSGGYTGGIIGGYNTNTAYTLTRCFNSGSVTAASSANLRPIAGTVSSATTAAGQFSNCYYTSTDTYSKDNYGVETFVADATVASSLSGLGSNWVIVDGYTPELDHFHSHVYEYVSIGANHQQVCYCGDTKTAEEHNYVNGVCDKCGAEDIPCAHENKYEIVEIAPTCSSEGSKHEYCPDCKIKVSADVEIPADANNHSGTLAMALANGAVTYTCSDCNAVAYTDTALLDTVYVSENGKELVGNVTAQIGTEANPFKNFTDAMQYAAYCGKDVTIRILDNASTPASYVTPAFDSTITITGGKLVTNGRFIMSGKLVFEHMIIAPATTLVMATHENKLVMGEGLTMSGSGIYLVGGYESGLDTNSKIPATGYTTDITLRSGTYHAVGGGNRYLSGAYSGTIKLTIGKTNENDTLEITSTLTTVSMNAEGGNGVYATVIFDGPVDINSFCPVTHATTAEGRFDIDIVVKGAATTDASKLYWRGSNYTVNVYADDRVVGAEDFAAIVAGAENVQPYKRYCYKINDKVHPDANSDAVCDNCGAPTACEHEYGEWRETAVANCASAEVYTWYCFDCQELIDSMTKNGDALDSTNHVSDSFVWQYANGKYFFGCLACGSTVEQTVAPTIYVTKSGNNALDGTTVQKAVATVEEAVSRIANVGGKVVICGTYTLTENLTLPAYTKEITISGYNNAGDFDGFVITKNTVITLGGATKFDEISFGGTSTYVFECMWNDTTFGKVQPYNKATAYVVLGDYGITENDTETATATLTITDGTLQRHTESGVRYVDRFYGRVYLGDTFSADGISVSGKTATFNATNADIGVLYTMSTSGTYKNNPVTNCETTVNLYGETKVDKGRTGDFNVAYADSTAMLDKQTINFFDNSIIGTSYYIRNAKDTEINVSTAADGRTVKLRMPFTFYAYGTFATEQTPMNVDVNYSIHSFNSSVEAPCTFSTAANALKVYSETVANECEYTPKVTVAATPDANGTILYSCTCGRSYTEEYAYSCDDATHVYIAKADGGYECTVCGESFANYAGDNVFAASLTSLENGVATLTVTIDGTFAAALANISLPSGFAFSNVTAPECGGIAFSGAECNGVYSVTALSNDGTEKTVNATFVITCTYADVSINVPYLFEVTVPELYDVDGNALVATTVSAEYCITVELVSSISADAGYYAESVNAESQVGVISFNAEIENYGELEIESFGFYVYNEGKVEKANVVSSDVQLLKDNDGKINLVITNIPTENFASKVLALPYVVVNGETVIGEICTFCVNNSLKWLGEMK